MKFEHDYEMINRMAPMRFDPGQTKRRVEIHAPTEPFLKKFGFAG
jgi:hypothetical protein